MFKKNQIVFLVQSYDDRGTFTYRRAVVRACGKKEMTLIDALTGENMGRTFTPAVAQRVGSYPGLGLHFSEVLPTEDKDQAAARATELAKQYVAFQVEQMDKRLADPRSASGYAHETKAALLACGGKAKEYHQAREQSLAEWQAKRAAR